MEGGERAITDLCLVADRERTPMNYLRVRAFAAPGPGMTVTRAEFVHSMLVLYLLRETTRDCTVQHIAGAYATLQKSKPKHAAACVEGETLGKL